MQSLIRIENQQSQEFIGNFNLVYLDNLGDCYIIEIMDSPESPIFAPIKEKAVTPATVDKINSQLRRGDSLWNVGVLKLLRKLPRPICVDIDGTLATYYHSDGIGMPGSKRVYIAAPGAVEAMRELREIGSVVIVTGNNDMWEVRQKGLEEIGLWQPGVVMIDAYNFNPGVTVRKYGRSVTKRRKPLKAYDIMSSKRSNVIDVHYQKKGMSSEFDPLVERRLQWKNMAPVFDKPYDIPIIDDDMWNTDNTPGMLGLLVPTFEEMVSVGDVSVPRYSNEKGRVTLNEAVKRVKEHYSSPMI